MCDHREASASVPCQRDALTVLHKPVIGIVVPTVGRWERLAGLLGSLSAGTAAGTRLHVIVIDQSHGAGASPHLPEGLAGQVISDAGQGASRARNIGWRALPAEVTHAVWANDHSVYPVDSLQALSDDLSTADVVVGALLETGVERYSVAAEYRSLTKDTVWSAIEPTCAIAVSLVRAVGGWDEQLGSGAESPWQSSALADLLLRIAQLAPRTRWDPQFLVGGGGFARGASSSAMRAKARSYGRGYGRVLSRWDYPVIRRAGAVAAPLLRRHYSIGPDELTLTSRGSLSLGRLEGVLGVLAPGARRSPREHDDLVQH